MTNIVKTEPAPTLDPVTCLAVIDALMNHEGETAAELSEKLGLPLKTVMAVMAHPEFVKRFHKIKKAVAKTEFDTVAYDRLIQIVRKQENPDMDGMKPGAADKNAIAAARALSEILGVGGRKGGPLVNINLGYDEIIRQANQKGNDGEVIFPGFEDSDESDT